MTAKEAVSSGIDHHAEEERQYSIFSKVEKRYIVFLIAFAGWFSTLSSFIYYPVIKQIAGDIDTTVENINLTATSYLAVSAVAPSITGDAADSIGRRPLYIIVLSVYVLSNVGIALQKSFVALLLLRMLQSAAISGTFSIAYGVVADIATPAERGGYVGALSFGITSAPSLGPVIGSAFGSQAGWRWIFWFLSTASGSCLLAMIFTLPETGRSLVGDGSRRPPRLCRLPTRLMTHLRDSTSEEASQVKRSCHVPNPLKCLLLLFHLDTLLTVLGVAILYMVYCCLNATLSTLFIQIYNLDQLQAGLIYLPFGAGAAISTVLSGRLIDRSYRHTAKSHNLPLDKAKGDDLNQFPIEKARLRIIHVPLLLTVCSVIGYGWALEAKAHIAVPLVIQALSGLGIQTCFNIGNTLIVDINHGAPATAQASSNVIRCSLAAAVLAVLQFAINGIGAGWTFTMLGLVSSSSYLAFLLEKNKGMAYRLKRNMPASTSISEP